MVSSREEVEGLPKKKDLLARIGEVLETLGTSEQEIDRRALFRLSDQVAGLEERLARLERCMDA